MYFSELKWYNSTDSDKIEILVKQKYKLSK